MMVKNLNHLGVVLAAAAGTLVAGGLLLLMLLVVVEPAGAAFPGKNGKIAFVHHYTVGGVFTNYEIYTVNANGTGLDRLTNNPASDGDPAWSPDCCTPIPGGNQIAFTSDRDGDYEIYTMNPALAISGPLGLIFIPTDRLTNNPARDLEPAWSPDGNKIAFTSDRDGNDGKDEIYTMNANGTGLDRLTNNHPQDDFEPAWSPDGNKIAFTSDRDGNDEIYTMNANGTGLDRLTNNTANDLDPDWSPDGNKIAFMSLKDCDRLGCNEEIYTMNSNGTGLDRLTNNTANDREPAWSPDGNKITFVSDRDLTDYEIYTMNSNGTALAPLTNNTQDDFQPDWQPLGDDPGVCVPPFCN